MRSAWVIVREQDGEWRYAKWKNNRIYWDKDPEDATLYWTKEEAEKIVENYESSRWSKHDLAVIEI